MTDFNERERAFESKFSHDQELDFKANAKRTKMVGLWAAEEMKLAGADAEAYAKALVMHDMDEPGSDDVRDKVFADFQAASVDISLHLIEKKMEELLVVAREEVMKAES